MSLLGKRYIAGGPHRAGWRPTALRAAALGIAPALALGAALGGVHLANSSSQEQIAAVVAADTPFTITGHGKGHGRGMGQWGAYGYAKEQGWAAERILAHFYGGTTLGQLEDSQISVRLQWRDDQPLHVYSDAGAVVAGKQVAPGEGVHLTPIPGGGANVVVTEGCTGAVVWQGTTDHPWVDPIDLAPERPANEHLKFCGNDAAYRGSLGVVLDGDAARTVNLLNIDDYLLGVVPAESKASWADTGGAEALRAQAVAARSYAAAENRKPYADTCDTQDCQVYAGTAKEDPRTTDAVRTTSGVVLMRDNEVVPAEFSASTGGYSAGGDFPAVADEGDAASPHHDWTVTKTAGEIGRAFGVGELQSIDVISRNNFGPNGGRAATVKVVGTTGTEEVTGMEAREALDLNSDWFSVTEGVGVPDAPDAAPEPGPESEGPVGTEPGSPIEEKYRELGGTGGTLGAPTGPVMSLPSEAGTFRMYENGTIIWTETLGVQVIDADVIRQVLPGMRIGE